MDTAPAAATAATEQVLPAMPDLEPFQAVLQRADAEVASAEARHAQAARDLARLKPLWDAKVASDRDYDDAVSAAVRAWADVERARVQRTQAVLFSRITGSVDTGAGIPRR